MAGLSSGVIYRAADERNCQAETKNIRKMVSWRVKVITTGPRGEMNKGGNTLGSMVHVRTHLEGLYGLSLPTVWMKDVISLLRMEVGLCSASILTRGISLMDYRRVSKKLTRGRLVEG